jgi:hypothetical protein
LTSRLRGLDTAEARIQRVSPEIRRFIDRVNAAHPIRTVFDWEGQPDFRALLNFMAEHGFRFAEFVEEHRVEGKLIFADAAFENQALT